ncbi:unnamed protein product, partial [Rotaria socialis]
LDTTTPYAFILCATARMGCGEASINRLLTTENRNRPAAQYPPTISESSITSTSLILTWRKDYDFNYAPIRYDFASIGTNNRLKVLIKSLSNEHVVEKIYYLINENYSIRLNNICKNSYNMNETDALNVCLSSTSGDGPLLYAYYFHMQSSAPIQWNVFVRMIQHMIIVYHFQSYTNTSLTRVKTIKQTLLPNITSLHIDDLDPYQFYELTLCACII